MSSECSAEGDPEGRPDSDPVVHSSQQHDVAEVLQELTGTRCVMAHAGASFFRDAVSVTVACSVSNLKARSRFVF